MRQFLKKNRKAKNGPKRKKRPKNGDAPKQ
jgi:hypothetical protein